MKDIIFNGKDIEFETFVVWELAKTVFGSRLTGMEWMQTPNRLFFGATPDEYCNTGKAKLVYNTLIEFVEKEESNA